MRFKQLPDLDPETLEKFISATAEYRTRVAVGGDPSILLNRVNVDAVGRALTADKHKELRWLLLENGLCSGKYMATVELLTAFSSGVHIDAHEAGSLFYNVVLRPNDAHVSFCIFDQATGKTTALWLRPGVVFVFDPLVPHSLTPFAPALQEVLLLQIVFKLDDGDTNIADREQEMQAMFEHICELKAPLLHTCF